MGRQACRNSGGATYPVDPAGVLADVVNPVRHGAALAADEEVVDPHFLRLALRDHSRPAFLKSPTSSFFLVSTEIAGSLAASAAFT